MAGLIIATVREAVVNKLRAAPIARAVAFHAYNPFPDVRYATFDPAAVIISHADPGPEYQGTFGAAALTMLPLDLEVRTWAAEGTDAERAMDALLSVGTGSDSSLFDALSIDPTFGLGADVSAHVGDPSPPRPLTNGSTTYWSARIPLTIRTKRT